MKHNPKGGAVVGVSKPLDNYNKTWLLCATGYYWSTGTQTNHSTIYWVDGGVMAFTLDCGARTLEMHLQRTGERSVQRDLDFSQPLFPALYLSRPGNEIEFI